MAAAVTVSQYVLSCVLRVDAPSTSVSTDAADTDLLFDSTAINAPDATLVFMRLPSLLVCISLILAIISSILLVSTY